MRFRRPSAEEFQETTDKGKKPQNTETNKKKAKQTKEVQKQVTFNICLKFARFDKLEKLVNRSFHLLSFNIQTHSLNVSDYYGKEVYVAVEFQTTVKHLI